MNLHQHMKIFEVFIVVAIVTGLTLVFSLVFVGIRMQTFDRVAGSLEIFDVTPTLPIVLETAEFPIVAMGEFYEEFYVAFEATASIPEEHIALASNFFTGMTNYAEFMAANYTQVAAVQQQNYSGQILGALIVSDPNLRIHPNATNNTPRVDSDHSDDNSSNSDRYTAPNLQNLFSNLKSLISKLQP